MSVGVSALGWIGTSLVASSAAEGLHLNKTGSIALILTSGQILPPLLSSGAVSWMASRGGQEPSYWLTSLASFGARTATFLSIVYLPTLVGISHQVDSRFFPGIVAGALVGALAEVAVANASPCREGLRSAEPGENAILVFANLGPSGTWSPEASAAALGLGGSFGNEWRLYGSHTLGYRLHVSANWLALGAGRSGGWFGDFSAKYRAGLPLKTEKWRPFLSLWAGGGLVGACAGDVCGGYDPVGGAELGLGFPAGDGFTVTVSAQMDVVYNVVINKRLYLLPALSTGLVF